MKKVRILVFFLAIGLGFGLNSCGTVGRMFNKKLWVGKGYKTAGKGSEKKADKDYEKTKKKRNSTASLMRRKKNDQTE